MQTTIYLARHATPDWSRTDIPYHLPPGPPLVERGLEEARQLGEFFRQAGVHRLYCSPMERCHHTARIAASVAGIPLEVNPGLTELQPGEDSAALRRRLWPAFLAAARDAGAGGPVAIVTHGGPVGFLLGELGMLPHEVDRLRTFDHRNPVPPAGAWEAYRPNSAAPWQLRLAFAPELEAEPYGK